MGRVLCWGGTFTMYKNSVKFYHENANFTQFEDKSIIYILCFIRYLLCELTVINLMLYLMVITTL